LGLAEAGAWMTEHPRKLKRYQVARDITYATSAQTRMGRAVIRLLENTTGRLSLIRRAEGYEDQVAAGHDFWQVMCDRYGLKINYHGAGLEGIPEAGPLILIANHPFGILDGLIMGHILSQRRGGDFRILAHQIFRKAPDLERIILPVSFDETKEAVAQNITTRKAAFCYLDQGGAIGIFPGGTVSTAAKPFGVPMDPDWRVFTARMVARSGATVIPIFFEGQNSRLFQIMSHIHVTLRMGLLIREFRKRMKVPLEVTVGRPISRQDMAAHLDNPPTLMDFLRSETYRLSQTPIDPRLRGFEFDQKRLAKRHERQEDGGRHI